MTGQLLAILVAPLFAQEALGGPPVIRPEIVACQIEFFKPCPALKRTDLEALIRIASPV